MAISIRLVVSKGSYAVHCCVPAELFSVIRRKTLNQSLGTNDRAEAIKRMAPIALDIQKRIDALLIEVRAEAPTNEPKVTGYSILRAKGANLPKIPDSPKIRAALENVFLFSAETRFGVAESDARSTFEIVDRLVAQFDIPMERYSAKHWQLCMTVLRIRKGAPVAKGLKAAQSKLTDGILDNAAQDMFLKNATVLDVLGAYRDELGKRWSPLNHYRFTNMSNLMIGMLGGLTPIRSLTRLNFIEARDVFDKLSPRFRTNFETKHLPIREASQKCVALGLPPLSIVTVNGYMKAFRSVMIYAEAGGFVERNCATKLFRNPRPEEVNLIMPFSIDQLKQVFNDHRRYSVDRAFEERDALFWVPLISLYQGLRIGEAAQLHACDITEIEGIPVIIICAADTGDASTTKLVKTKFSRRIVPIHSALIKIGLVEFAQLMKSLGNEKLFPRTTRGWLARFDLLAHQMTADIRKAGAHTSQNSARSFRHNFRDALRNADVPEDAVRWLGGWQPKSIADSYGGGPNLQNLNSHLQKISYPGLDLSHLAFRG